MRKPTLASYVHAGSVTARKTKNEGNRMKDVIESQELCIDDGSTDAAILEAIVMIKRETDWRVHYRRHTLAMHLAAFGGGLALAGIAVPPRREARRRGRYC